MTVGRITFTPGPWKVERIDYELRLDTSFEVLAGKRLVAQTLMRENATDAENIAVDEVNVNLIAAAPDLLAALKLVVTYFPAALASLSDEQRTGIHAAIAKAEGRC